MTVRVISGLVACTVSLTAALVACPVIAQQQAPVARLTGVQGNVLVSQRDGMAAATNEQKLAPGVRVITTAGATATVAYDKGCTVNLGENRRYTVRERAECAPAKAPPLGMATGFAVLAWVGVDNGGASVVRGNLGVSPGTRVAGFPQGRVIEGAIQPPGTLASQAQRDVATAFADLSAQPCQVELTGQDLGGQVLTPGIYCYPRTSAQLTGELVLDAQGDANAVFVFQIGTTLRTAVRSVVRVINDEVPGDTSNQSVTPRDQRRQTGMCNVFWVVGESATLGKESAFIGSVIAHSDITLSGDARLYGRALSRTGVVALDANTVEVPSCVVPLAQGPDAGAVGTSTAGTAAGIGNIVGIGGLIGGGAVVVEAVRRQTPAQPVSPN